jgi:hypothetical protein
MKKYKAPSTAQKNVAKAIIVVTSPIWIWPILLIFAYCIFKMFTVWRPIILFMRFQPLYWLNWHEVKRLSGKSSSDVLTCLASGTTSEVFECRLREDIVVARLRRHRHLPTIRLPEKGPLLNDLAIFYEYRLKDKEGRRRPTLSSLLRAVIPQQQPGLRPAYA